eukprot:COSAG02_NODE_6666_length_3431_cov_1.865246_4_plen_73_part_00
MGYASLSAVDAHLAPIMKGYNAWAVLQRHFREHAVRRRDCAKASWKRRCIMFLRVAVLYPHTMLNPQRETLY